MFDKNSVFFKYFVSEKTHNSNLFVVIIMVLLIILILITVVLCQNMYVIGTNTRKLTTGS